MPSIEENKEFWGEKYDWSNEGDEWSRGWGGTPFFWCGILPRMIRFVPCDTIVEIGPGYGRFTQYLIKLCKNLIIVDLNKNCIDACKKRFQTDSNIKYIVNDGKKLTGIPNDSVDFVFSWGTLVHCDDDVVKSYIFEAKRVLKDNGNAFFHYSSLILPDNESKKFGFSKTMTAEKFVSFCKEAGVSCNYQEIFDADLNTQACISFFTKRNKELKTKVFNNKDFYREIINLKRVSEAYNPANY